MKRTLLAASLIFGLFGQAFAQSNQQEQAVAVSPMKSYSHPMGFTFEAPEHWVEMSLADSLLMGATLGYMREGQTSELGKEMFKQMGNVAILESPYKDSTDVPLAAVSVGLLETPELPNNMIFDQAALRFINSDPNELAAFIASATQSNDTVIADMNKSLLGIGSVARNRISVTDQNNLICIEAISTTTFFDSSESVSVNLNCPLGSHMLQVEVNIADAISDEEFENAAYIADSFRISERLETQPR